MPVNITDLHRVINDLFISMDDKSSEAIWRAYINRSYYVIFHELKLAMENAGIDTNRYETGTHNNLCVILDDMAKHDKSVQKLALQFKDFLTKRHLADYELSKTMTWYDVKQVQKYLKELPEIIANHIKSHNKME